MSIAIVTGSSGLIGSEAVQFLAEKGFEVVGIDNDMRAYFFGETASNKQNEASLIKRFEKFSTHNTDIRNFEEVDKIFARYGKEISLVVHTAAQPSHDWAAKEPFTDFSVNANGTLNLLEASRKHCPEAVFIFTSTNKVYGDTPNNLPLIEADLRWEVNSEHKFAAEGIDESMSIDQTKHSLFGASKVAADVLVQEYGRYFGMKTVSFRGGCLTGPAHHGAELHGFLAYLIQCAVTGKEYTVFGYKGKQVRDNIHSKDLIKAFWEFYKKPRVGEVYNIGGSRYSNISILEAIKMIKDLSGHELKYKISDKPRAGDHIWYISDVRKFQEHYPGWKYEYNIEKIISEMLAVAEATLNIKN
ncbi:MAG: NAD-dependent epimerase/dehydratase family protein [Candidatus Doudnabacteria bacterium]|nr:NAD-dependent epimerase/dehydratase family protein [Candidatus Doudnabacteria bacterium]